MGAVAASPPPPFARFPSWRPGQLETVEAVLAGRRRFSLVTAPTGSGKSLIAASVVNPAAGCRDCEGSGIRDSGGFDPQGHPIDVPCDHNVRPGFILTATRQLQDQYLLDFPDFAELRGISRYPCAAVEDTRATRLPPAVGKQLHRMALGEVPPNAKCAPCHDSPWRPWREVESRRLPGGRVVVQQGRWVDPCPLTHDGCTYVAAREAVSRHDRPAILNYHVWAALRALESPGGPCPSPTSWSATRPMRSRR